MRILIADDESHCRLELKHLLADYSDIEVVGEALNGLQALEQTRNLTPDLLFLDINMPGLSGLEVATALDTDPLPTIVFVTAYDQHAIKAFELGAIDYLLKPITPERLEQTLTRIRKKLSISPPDNTASTEQISSLMKVWTATQPDYLARIVCRKGQRMLVIPIADVYCFEMESQMLYAVCEKERYWTNYQLKSLEPRLDPKKFVRSHRESIVNIEYIRELAPITRERYELTLHNNYKINVSRNYLPEIKELLGWI